VSLSSGITGRARKERYIKGCSTTSPNAFAVSVYKRSQFSLKFYEVRIDFSVSQKKEKPIP